MDDLTGEDVSESLAEAEGALVVAPSDSEASVGGDAAKHGQRWRAGCGGSCCLLSCPCFMPTTSRPGRTQRPLV